MADITFKIEESFVAIKTGDWTLELNLVSWNGRASKYEIRKWDAKHEKMGKGVTLTKEEVVAFLSQANVILERLGETATKKEEMTELPF